MALGTNGCRQVLPAGSLPHGSDAPPPHLRLAPGPSFHGASLLEEQAAALARNVELTTEAAVDAVVIAGDLYDRAIPPAEAVQLFNDTLARLRESGATVVAIAGNHDSHVRCRSTSRCW